MWAEERPLPLEGVGDVGEYRIMYAGTRRVTCFHENLTALFARDEGLLEAGGSVVAALRNFTKEQIESFKALDGPLGGSGLVSFSQRPGEIAYLPSGWLTAESVMETAGGFAWGFRWPVVASYVANDLKDVPEPSAVLEDLIHLKLNPSKLCPTTDKWAASLLACPDPTRMWKCEF